jgi:membrane-bound metal-dependent hydrolase YbcI (DUF457 family)
MDTITHGIAGALIGKALFDGDDLFAFRPMNPRRIVTWSLMLGAIFPDADVFREMFSHNELLILTWHRSITHSLALLPIWALLLAGLTRLISREFKWEAPSFAALAGIYAVGLASHIFLDLVTTFGTMIWSPLEWSRPAWDLLFIVDFTFAGILLLPQFLAWVYSDPKNFTRRALSVWLFSALVPVVVAAIARNVGAPISDLAILLFLVVLSALILSPMFHGWGLRVAQQSWNRAGLFTACIYLFLALTAHHFALKRVQKFAAFEHLDSQSIAALPLPPSLWHWDGLILTPRGVYDLRMDLSQKSAITETSSAGASTPSSTDAPALEYRYYPEAFPNSYTAAARNLPEVQTFLWFARFPVTRFHMEGAEAVVEFFDARFPQLRPSRNSSFTYRVRFNAAGRVLSKGWAR